MGSLSRSFSQLWESTQVELRGKYSAERVLELTKYTNERSWWRVIAVLLVTPLPCLLVTVLVDIIPLANPSEGLKANNLYFVRTYYTFLVITFLAIQQFRMSVSLLPYPLWRAIGHTVIVSALSTGILYAFALAIGFPLPFSLLTTTPLWVVLISITMVFEWGGQVRKTPGAATMIVNAIKLWMCEVLLVFIYPPYFYVFTTLSERAQNGFRAAATSHQAVDAESVLTNNSSPNRRTTRSRDLQLRRLQRAVCSLLHAELALGLDYVGDYGCGYHNDDNIAA
ncbi:hypothetical protein PF006_g16131 [Phytophthora fragariae]|uniref:Uncharacterized protein n=1 Tax=Phytophthora fragariae TaxID=53985 RepID=A0A6A3T8G3_9STRA|nr:hypothetical protein PF006_g16131 [Phytophthora fragariae]